MDLSQMGYHLLFDLSSIHTEISICLPLQDSTSQMTSLTFYTSLKLTVKCLYIHAHKIRLRLDCVAIGGYFPWQSLHMRFPLAVDKACDVLARVYGWWSEGTWQGLNSRVSS